MLTQLADHPSRTTTTSPLAPRRSGPSSHAPSATAARVEAAPEGPSVAAVATEVLEVVLELDAAGERTPVTALRERLPVPDGHLDAAVASLVEDGVLAPVDGHDRAAGRELAFTAAGRERAVTVVRRHRLAERLLSDVLGLDWWKVHHEAERFEGAISDDVEARLVELLGDPGTCPHGNPIPGSGNQPDQAAAVLLAEAPLGPVHVVRITETLEGDDEALQLLQQCGFVPGRDAEVKDRQQGWVEVAGTVRDAALPPHVVAHTWVAPL